MFSHRSLLCTVLGREPHSILTWSGDFFFSWQFNRLCLSLNAYAPRAALTPPRGRGPRQRPAAAPRGAALDLVRHDQRVAGWRRGARAPQGERPPPDVGRGRGAARRPTRGLPPTRAPLPRLARHEAPSTRPGWPPAHKTQRPDTPTAARILPAWAAVALTRLTQAAGGAILRRRTPLAGGQEDLLPRLGVGTAL